MSDRATDQLYGLAGLFQAARLVGELARDGQCDESAFAASIGSVLAIDAESAAAVYGGPPGIAHGVPTLIDTLEGRAHDPMVLRIASTVMRLERTLARRPAMAQSLREGIDQAARSAQALGAGHDAVSARLGELYAQTLSTLQPRVMVQGNGLYLSQARIVARIRAMLLAAIRGAVLWRQKGGNRLMLLLARKLVADRARALVRTTEA